MPSPDRPRTRYSWLDIALPGALVAAVIVAGVVTSAKKYLWYDELFGWTFATDPSLGHALRAVADGADAGTPLFYVVAWLSTRVFGPSELAFRGVVCACFALAIVVLWRTLRTAYPPRAVALGLVTATVASAATAYQFSEGRFYGLLTLAVALSIACYVTTDRPELPLRSRVVTALSHTMLVYAHTIGLFYSAAILVASMVRDGMHGRLRAGRYVPILAAWATLIVWLPAIHRQSDLAKPHSWVSPPSLTDFADAYLFGISPLPLVILLTLALSYVARRASPDASSPAESSPGRDSMLVLAYALFSVPLVAFIVSRTVTPLFLPRYFIPAAIGWAIVIAHLAAPAERPAGAVARRAIVVGWALAFAILVLKPVAAAIAVRRSERPGLAVEQVVPPDVPVVVDGAIDFLPFAHYSPHPGGYYYILDWPTALDPRAELEATVDYKVMDAWRRNGLLSARIVQGETFLRDHDRFVVIDDKPYGWYEHAVRDDPAYTSRVISDRIPIFGGTARAILVQRAPRAP